MGLKSMSGREFSRLDVLLDVEAGRLAIDDACDLIELRRRQVFCLRVALRQHKATSLISKRLARPSNSWSLLELPELTTGIGRERFADVDPTPD